MFLPLSDMTSQGPCCHRIPETVHDDYHAICTRETPDGRERRKPNGKKSNQNCLKNDSGSEKFPPCHRKA